MLVNEANNGAPLTMSSVMGLPAQFGRRREDSPVDEEPQLGDYFAVLRRRWRAIVATLTVSALAAVCYLLTAAPVYRASATLLLEPQLPKFISIQNLKESSELEDYYATQLDIIRSRSVAEAVLRQLDVQDLERLRAPPWWRRLIPQDWRPNVSHDPAALKESHLQLLRNSLTVEQPKNNQMVTVSIDAAEAELAARICNLVTGAYADLERGARADLNREANQWLASQLNTLRRNLSESETALQAYQVREGILDSESIKTTNREKLSAISQALVEAQNRRAKAEVRYKQVIESRRSGNTGSSSLPSVVNSAAVQSLKLEEAKLARAVKEMEVQEGDRSPKLRAARADLAENTRRLHSEMATAVDSVRNDYNAALEHEKQLLALNDNLKDSLQKLTSKEYGLTRLEREVATNQQLVNMFLERTKEVGVTSGFSATNIRIIDKAVAARDPYSPNLKRVVALATLFGLSAGVVLAFLRENLDRRFHSIRHLERRLRLPALGIVPRLAKRIRLDRPIAQQSDPWFTDSIRSIEGRIKFSADERTRIVLVTSSVPGEGKSTLAGHLAVSFSRSEKTLLINGDLRKSSRGERVGLLSGTGLANFLHGECPLAECIKADNGSEMLFKMSCGDLQRNPIETLSPDRLQQAAEKLRQNFERVIIDGPPALVGGDLNALCRLADSAIFVVKADDVAAPIVQEMLQNVRASGVNVLGAVLSQVAESSIDNYHGYRYLRLA